MTATRAPVRRMTTSRPVARVSWLPGTASIVFSSDVGYAADDPLAQVGVLSAAGDTVWSSDRGRWRVWDLAPAPDDQLVAVIESTERDDLRRSRAHVLRVGTNEVVWSQDEQAFPYGSGGRFFIQRVLFTPDGRWLLGCGPLVHKETGEPLSKPWRLDLRTRKFDELLPDDRDVRDLAVSPDSRLVAIATGDGLVVVEADTGGEVRELRVEGGVSAVAFGADSLHVAAACNDGNLRLIRTDQDDGRPTIISVEPGVPVYATAFSPDGKWAAAVVDTGIGLYGVSDAGPRFQPIADVRNSSKVAFSPDLRYFAAQPTMDDTFLPGLALLDVRTGARLWHSDGGEITDFAFSEDGSRLVAGGKNADGTSGFVHVYDTGAEQRRIPLGGAVTAVVTLQQRPAARLALLAGIDPVRGPLATVLNLDSGAAVLERAHPAPVTALAFSPDGECLVTGCADRMLRLFRGFSSEAAWTFGHGAAVTVLAFSPTGEWIVTGSADRFARMIGRDTGEPRWQHAHQGAVTAVGIAPDDTWVATGSADRSTRILDAATGEERHSLQQDRAVVALALGPDGGLLATGNQDGTVRLLDTSTGTELGTVAHSFPIGAIAVSPDGTTLASGDNRGTVRLSPVADLRLGERDPLTYRAPVTQLLFSPAGDQLAILTEDPVVEVINPADRVPAYRLIHPDRVRDLAFSADGAVLVTGCDDGIVRVFSTRSS